MRGAHNIWFPITAVMFALVAAVTAWSAIHGPSKVFSTFVGLHAAALLMAAVHTLTLCWLSASTAYEPKNLRPLGWLRAEAAVLVVAVALAVTVLAASIDAVGDAPYSPIAVPVALCGAGGMAVCAMAYAVGRLSVLLRKRQRRRKRRQTSATSTRA